MTLLFIQTKESDYLISTATMILNKSSNLSLIKAQRKEKEKVNKVSFT